MNAFTIGLIQIVAYFVVLLLLVRPLGTYMANVFSGERTFLTTALRPIERLIYSAAGTSPEREMNWRTYAVAVLLFNAAGMLLLYAILRIQTLLPLNPAALDAVPAHLAFNTSASFASNTNWQFYGGETTMSYLAQMSGLTVQNFLSAATGIAVLIAFIRGLSRQKVDGIGNFWVDLTRTVLYVLLPLSLIFALIFVSQGVVQTFSPYETAQLIQPAVDAEGNSVSEQLIAVGPAASQVAIKQLGTNGGGFFNVNSAHPLENPTPVSNFFQLLAILLLPAALCYTFGKMVGDTRQGWALLAAVGVVFALALGTALWAEQGGNPALASPAFEQVDQTASLSQSGGNMEGKETRFGIANSALWATATTATSNGSVNSMHDSYTPLGGFVPLLMMQLGEVIFGGVGSGLYGLLAFVIVAVFVAGLMVGRTPEYLGKKIESYEMKMAALVILIPPALVLLGTGLGVVTEWGRAAMQETGPHGFSEILYAFSSQGNNNGSAFAGIGNSAPFSWTGGVAMLVARYWLIIPILAIAGALANKAKVPAGVGTLPTHGPLFVSWLVTVVLIVGALAFIPALTLGPIAEFLLASGGATF